MAHPIWLSYLLAVVLMGVGAYCVSRLVAVVTRHRHSHYDVNGAHVLMALAMVGMFVPRWRVLPVGWWEVVFTAMAAWFLAQTFRVLAVGGPASLAGDGGRLARHHLMHGVMAGTMVYMYGLGNTAGGATGMSMSADASGIAHPHSGAYPAVTLLLLVVLLASVVWQLDAASRFATSRPVTGSAALVMAVPVPVGASGPAGGPGRTAVATGLAERPWLAPRLEVGCHIAMCLAMAYMLVLTF